MLQVFKKEDISRGAKIAGERRNLQLQYTRRVLFLNFELLRSITVDYIFFFPASRVQNFFYSFQSGMNIFNSVFVFCLNMF